MRDTPLKTVCLVSFACASAFGCLESEGTLGEAQNGSFQYECLDWGDPVCDGEQPTGLFDPSVRRAKRAGAPAAHRARLRV